MDEIGPAETDRIIAQALRLAFPPAAAAGDPGNGEAAA
jgi:hypothetical protein